MSPIAPQTALSKEGGFGRLKLPIRQNPEKAVPGTSNRPFDRRRFRAPQTARSTESRAGGSGRLKPPVRQKPDQAVSGTGVNFLRKM
ncbi:hypothetical protein AVEN_221605-1 [Araneus ventricosus]|uniref:Uncharacterized protein n=1 Tax=Araneus ventricosus TaxID=182803 RepID=A0A4Y2T2B5_ARAVE|nr:hypothetical protein AVEN_107909-1 [Araneus ventricosus]GBN93582.1 hypothetical protein AVEN_261301-1 [Araneus ventricosus]GBN96600.1 hypothetical protein AVEN_28265-1 [Araneus ventricosus]GBN96602.1 hypothetical protein AVEN_221605-1 [Araneus ventricosus]